MNLFIIKSESIEEMIAKKIAINMIRHISEISGNRQNALLLGLSLRRLRLYCIMASINEQIAVINKATIVANENMIYIYV